MKKISGFYLIFILLLLSAGVAVYLFFLKEYLPENVSKSKPAKGITVFSTKNAITELLTKTDEFPVGLSVSGKMLIKVKQPLEFYAMTAHVKISCTDCSFLVNSDDNQTEIIVQSGVVAVRKLGSIMSSRASTMDFEPGDKCIAGKHITGLIKQNVKPENHLAWFTHAFDFNGEKLKNVAPLIEEAYDIKITWSHAVLGNCQITAKWQKKSPEEIAKILSQSLGGSTYQIDQKGNITFDGKSCNN